MDFGGITVIIKKKPHEQVAPVTEKDKHEHECATRFHNAKMRRRGHLVFTKGPEDREVAPMPFIEPFPFMQSEVSDNEGKKEKIISVPKSLGEK